MKPKKKSSPLLPLMLAAALTGSAAQLAYAQGTLIPVPERRDHVYSNGVLYITTEAGLLQRYHTGSHQLLTPWNTGGRMRGIDVTPDGSRLLVGASDGHPGAPATEPTGNLQVVSTADGSISNISFERTNEIQQGQWYEKGVWDVVAVSNERAYFITDFAGTGWIPFREANMTTMTAIERPDLPGVGPVPGGAMIGDGLLTRSADRSVTLIEDISSNLRTIDTNTNSFGNGIYVGRNWIYSLSGVNRDGTLFAAEYGYAVGDTRERVQVWDADFNPVQTLWEIGGGFVFDPTRDVMYVADQVNDLVIALDTNSWQGLYALPIGEDIDNSGIFDAGMMSISDDGVHLFLSTPMGVRMFTVPEPRGLSTAAAALLLLALGLRRRHAG